MNIFYKGEDITLTFVSETDISAYTKTVKCFTPNSAIKEGSITSIDNFSFTATFTSLQTNDLKTGSLNIVLELTNAGAKSISKTVKCKLNDAYLDGGEREDSNDYTYSLNFKEGNTVNIFFGINAVLSQVYGWFTFVWKLFSGFTIAELRLLTNSQLALVTSFSCVEQGKKGQWYYDSTDTTSTDNTGTILVTTGGKRIKRRNPYDFVRLSWFILDYNADNTSICTYVFNNFTRVYIAKGETVKISSVQVDSAVELFGLGKIFKIANTELAVLEVNTDNFKYYNIEIDGNRSNQTSLTARGINTSNRQGDGFEALGFTIRNCYGEAIRVNSTHNTKIENYKIYNCHQVGNNKPIVIRNQFGSSENVSICGGLIDNRNNGNGGIAVQTAHYPNYCKKVFVNRNIVYTGGEIDNREALCIEFFSGYSPENCGLISEFEIESNHVECFATGQYEGVDRVFYMYGISLGGGSWQSLNAGIEHGKVNFNVIKNCRRIGLEIIARNIDAYANTLIDSGDISINSDTMQGGAFNINAIGNNLDNCGGLLGFCQIRLQSGLYPLSNVKVKGGQIKGGIVGNDAIVFSGVNTDSDKSKFYNIEIEGVTIDNVPNWGVYVRNTANVEDVRINGLDITLNNSISARGISFNAKTAKHTQINRNTFTSENTGNDYYAIQIYDNETSSHESFEVIGNSGKNFKRGLLTAGNYTSLLYHSNTWKNNSSYGINVTGSPTGIIKGANTYISCATNEIISNTAVIAGSFAEPIKNVIYTQGTSLTPSSGSVTVTNTRHGITGSGITTLSTITGGQTGQILVIFPNDNTNTILVKDGVGNLRLSGDFIMNHNQDRLMLEYDGTNWIELSRSDNAEEQSGRATLVAGTKTFTIEGLTSTSNVILSKFVGGGTHNTTLYYRAIPSTDSLTINALTSADEVNTTDTSTLIYKVL